MKEPITPEECEDILHGLELLKDKIISFPTKNEAYGNFCWERLKDVQLLKNKFLKYQYELKR